MRCVDHDIHFRSHYFLAFSVFLDLDQHFSRTGGATVPPEKSTQRRICLGPRGTPMELERQATSHWRNAASAILAQIRIEASCGFNPHYEPVGFYF
jgi:hypothetical protein